MRSAAAVALMLTAVGGAWQYAPKVRDLVRADLDDRRDARRSTIAMVSSDVPDVNNDAGGVPAGSTRAERSDGNASQPASQPSTLPSAAATGTAMGAMSTSDSITWVPAVARTWVNVRNDASRGGEVVGVIKPAARAMLGTDRAGWRQVRSPDVSGWVDPRLFEADSLRKSGE